MEPFLKELDKRSSQTKTQTEKQREQDLATARAQAVVNTIGDATKALIAFQKSHQPKVSVTNQKLPTSIKTPDVQLVVKALENLKQPILENKVDHTPVIEALQKLNDSIAKLPTAFPELPKPVEEVTVKNQPDYTSEFETLNKTLAKIDVKPVVNIPEEKPDDYTPITEALTNVIQAVKAIKIPEVPTTDLTPLITATESVQNSINNLKFPVANYILPFIDATGKAVQSPAPFIDKNYDDIAFTNPDGGGNYQTITFSSAGSAVRTLTLSFDGSNNVTHIARS